MTLTSEERQLEQRLAETGGGVELLHPWSAPDGSCLASRGHLVIGAAPGDDRRPQTVAGWVLVVH